jgi:tetratricopeptide (TPR) repeat protein
MVVLWTGPLLAARGPGPAAEMSRALELYERGKHHDASALLHRVVEGKTQDSAATRRRAEWWLGRTLFRLDLTAPAYSFFERIARRGRSDRYYLPALKWLVAIARRLPGSAAVRRTIGAYGQGVLKEPSLKALREELRLHLGRHHYNRGSFKRAAGLLGKARPGGAFYLRARLLEGMVHVRMFKARPAAAAFKAVLRAGARGKVPADQRRLIELARLSLARLFYSVRQHDKAVKHYDKIPRTSAQRRPALLEQGWAHYKLGAHRRALANLRALGAARDGMPEARYMEAVIYFANCRFRRSGAVARRAAARLKRAGAGLLALLGRYKDDYDLYRRAVEIRAGRGGVNRFARSALDDRQLDKRLAFVKELDRQLRLVQSAPAAWKALPVAGVALQDLTLQKSLAQSEAGSLARARLRRTAGELQQMVRQLELVASESRAALGSKVKPRPGCDRLGRGR